MKFLPVIDLGQKLHIENWLFVGPHDTFQAGPDFPLGPLGHGPGAACNSIKTQKRGGGTEQGNFALLYYFFL